MRYSGSPLPPVYCHAPIGRRFQYRITGRCVERAQRSTIAVTPIPPAVHTEIRPRPEQPRVNGFNAVRRTFINYARWLDSITWKRFFVIAVLSLVAVSLLSELPPFSIR